MGILGKIFKKKKEEQAQQQVVAFDVGVAREEERQFITSLIQGDNLKGNYEVECMAQLLINETDFLVDSDRVPKEQ